MKIPKAQLVKAILAEQDKNAGTGKNIVDAPVTLTVYLRNCPDLSVTDLPGAVMNPMGDQPQDIRDQTEKLIKSYCMSNEETIMLCVTKANDDLANSHGLLLTNIIDPTGNRTMGVLTKSDLAKPQIVRTFIEDSNEVNFRYGFTAVINKSKEDQAKGISIEQRITLARTYFDSTPEYQGCDKKFLGTENLRSNLSNILLEKMKNAFGPIQGDLMIHLLEIEQELY